MPLCGKLNEQLLAVQTTAESAEAGVIHHEVSTIVTTLLRWVGHSIKTPQWHHIFLSFVGQKHSSENSNRLRKHLKSSKSREWGNHAGVLFSFFKNRKFFKNSCYSGCFVSISHPEDLAARSSCKIFIVFLFEDWHIFSLICNSLKLKTVWWKNTTQTLSQLYWMMWSDLLGLSSRPSIIMTCRAVQCCDLTDHIAQIIVSSFCLILSHPGHLTR